MNDNDLKLRLQAAVRSQPVPPELTTRIRQKIEQPGSAAKTDRKARSSWNLVWAPALAASVVCVGLGLAYQAGYLRFTDAQREAFASTVLRQVPLPMKAGLDDHLHCSVFGEVPKDVPPLPEATKDLPPQFAPLLALVQTKMPEPFRIYSAHECLRSGRKFVHIQMKTDTRLVSVIVTRRSVDESFVREKIVPALAAGGESIYTTKAKRFHLAAIETRDFMAYLVSDLSSDQNLKLMLAMAPEVSSILRRLES